jgi:hypothetical protein
LTGAKPHCEQWVAELEQHVQEWLRQLQELRTGLDQDSTNRSKPSSTDQFV